MATFTAGFSALGSYRLRLEIWETTIDKPNNRSLVNWALYVDKLAGSGYWTFDSGNSCGVSGDVSASGSAWAPYDFRSYSTLLIGSGSQWVTHNADGTKTASGTYSASDSAGDNFGGASGTYSLVLSNTAQAPTAPSSVTATRTSDTSIGLAWTPNPASGKPYNGQSVYVSIDGATPVLVANVSASASSYTYAASANHKYVFYVDAANAAGTTRSSASNTILTTPATLASLSAVLVTSGTIRLTLPTRPTPYTEADVVIEETHNGGADWNAKATIAMSSLSASATTTWDDTSAETGGTVQYRARVATTGGTQGTLYSTWKTSNTLVLNTPPNAPTNLLPSGSVDASQPIRLRWTHSPSSDGAAQSSRKIEYSVDGGSSQTSIVTGDTTTGYYDWSPTLGDFTAGQTILWRVATAGSEPGTYGDWSSWQSLTLYGSLAVTLTADHPPVVHEGGPLSVQWTSSPTWGTASQVQYRVTLTDDVLSQIVYDTGMLTGGTQAVLIPSSVQVDGREYTVAVTLVDSNLITSIPATAGVETDYLAPGIVDLSWAYDDESGSLVFYPEFSEESSSAFDDTYEWTLERSLDGDTWEAIGSVVGAEPLTDLLPRLGAVSWYRSTAYTVLGVAGEPTVFQVFAANVTSRWGWLNYGEQFQSRVRFGWSQTVEISAGRASESYPIEGRDYPAAVFGDNLSERFSVSGKLIYGESSSSSVPARLQTASASAFRQLAKRADVCVFRDPRGEWIYARVADVKVTPQPTRANQADVALVSFTIERVSL